MTRLGLVALIICFASTAYAEPPSVHDELLAAADRAAARWGNAAAARELIDEHLASHRLDGLRAAVEAMEHERGMHSVADAGWNAAAYAAIGDRAAVERLAAKSSRDVDGVKDAMLVPAAHCALAVAWERLGDTARADVERALGKSGFCVPVLAGIAARAGRNDRAETLLEEQVGDRKVEILIDLIDAAIEAGDTAQRDQRLTRLEALLAAEPSGGIDPLYGLPSLAVRLERAGRHKRAVAAALRALTLLRAEGDVTMRARADDVAAGLAATKQKKPLAKLLADVEKLHRAQGGGQSLVLAARTIARFGSQARAQKLIDEVELAFQGAIPYGAQVALIDAYLGTGQIDHAIHQATNLSLLMQVEVSGLVTVARHCREHACKRTKAVDAALAELQAEVE